MGSHKYHYQYVSWKWVAIEKTLILHRFYGNAEMNPTFRNKNQCESLKQYSTLTRSAKNNVKVQSIDPNARVVLNSQVNVFLNTETKVSGMREVVTSQFVFPDFQTALKNFLSFSATHCTMHGDFFVTTDTKRSHGVSGFGKYRLLTCQLLQYLQNNLN